jgi:hypothetical protein
MYGGGGISGFVETETWYEGVSKSFRTGPLERELQMVQLSALGAVVSLFCESV